MNKLIPGFLILLGLAGCQAGSPVVGSWSYVTPQGAVSYTFNADKTCSLSVPDVATGGTKVWRGRYSINNASPAAPEQFVVDILWEGGGAPSVLPPAHWTPLTWNTTTRGFSINLNKQ